MNARVPSDWTLDPTHVAAFARELVLADAFGSEMNVVRYFESPSRYEPEHRRWTAMDRPLHGTIERATWLAMWEVILGRIILSPEAEEIVEVHGARGAPTHTDEAVVRELVAAGLLDTDDVDTVDGHGAFYGWTAAGRVFVAEAGR